MNITPELPINENTLINLSVEMAHSVAWTICGELDTTFQAMATSLL